MRKGISTRLTSFRKYCTEHGIQIEKRDLEFIDKTLDKFPESDFKPILQCYINKWYEGMGYTEIVYQKQNKGRYNANNWLLERSVGTNSA